MQDKKAVPNPQSVNMVIFNNSENLKWCNWMLIIQSELLKHNFVLYQFINI